MYAQLPGMLQRFLHTGTMTEVIEVRDVSG